MSVELLYTSAPSGLKRGSRGFCTVVSTAGTPANLASRLEALSAYRHVFSPNSPEAPKNPVTLSHLTMAVGGQPVSVLSRIADYGVDYSQRTNMLAHHVVLQRQELPAAGPAWLATQPGVLKTSWNGECSTPPQGPVIPQADRRLDVCRHWQNVTGDAGWAAVIADAFSRPAAKPTWIIVGLDLTSRLPALLEESIALMPANRRWNATFSTYATTLPPDVDCKVRCVLVGTDEARLAPARGVVIDLTEPLGRAPENAYTAAARSGVDDAPKPTHSTVQPVGPLPTSPVQADINDGSWEIALNNLQTGEPADLGELQMAAKPPALPKNRPASRIATGAVVGQSTNSHPDGPLGRFPTKVAAGVVAASLLLVLSVIYVLTLDPSDLPWLASSQAEVGDVVAETQPTDAGRNSDGDPDDTLASEHVDGVSEEPTPDSLDEMDGDSHAMELNAAADDGVSDEPERKPSDEPGRTASSEETDGPSSIDSGPGNRIENGVAEKQHNPDTEANELSDDRLEEGDEDGSRVREADNSTEASPDDASEVQGPTSERPIPSAETGPADDPAGDQSPGMDVPDADAPVSDVPDPKEPAYRALLNVAGLRDGKLGFESEFQPSMNAKTYQCFKERRDSEPPSRARRKLEVGEFLKGLPNRISVKVLATEPLKLRLIVRQIEEIDFKIVNDFKESSVQLDRKWNEWNRRPDVNASNFVLSKFSAGGPDPLANILAMEETVEQNRKALEEFVSSAESKMAQQRMQRRMEPLFDDLDELQSRLEVARELAEQLLEDKTIDLTGYVHFYDDATNLLKPLPMKFLVQPPKSENLQD